jgi:hypothetical protein
MRNFLTISIAAATALAATPALATNKADITQSGTGHVLDVEQQGGSAGSATIKQAGLNNQIFLTQSDNGSQQDKKNIATIDQKGTDNKINTGSGDLVDATLGQTHTAADRGPNVVGIKQNGLRNTIMFQQTDYENNMNIMQGLSQSRAAADHDDLVVARQTGVIDDAEITQTGNYNSSFSDQSGNLSKVTIIQSGIGNRQTVSQTASQETFKIIQGGTDNNSVVTQFDNNNFADVTQGGTANGLTIEQDQAFSSAKVNQGGDHSHITLTQLSNSANATIVQFATGSSIALVQ